jgi:GNAT superfamily N-acetyltransferase
VNPDYSIRYAKASDAPIIAQHRRKMFTDMGDEHYIRSTDVDAAYEQWVERKLTEGYFVDWLMTCGEEVIGGAALEIRERPPHPIELMTRYAYVMNVYVEPDYRQQGIARQLLQTILAWCAEQGLRLILLHASDKGQPLYESLGFEATNEMRLLVL